MPFLKLTHRNTKKAPVVDEEVVVNTAQIKFISTDPEGGSFIHFFNDDNLFKVLESMDEILEGLEDETPA